MAEFLWPRGGWVRAFRYVRHRLSRLPGSPEQIARGIFAGVFAIFTPFFGLHFVTAAIIAKLMRGSILAAILATFVGNPLTFVPIAYVSLQIGHFVLGSRPRDVFEDSLFEKFTAALRDLWNNTKAIFTDDQAHWGDLIRFYEDVFLPWTIGGIIPGLVVGYLFYAISVPLIRAYQTRRSARLAHKRQDAQPRFFTDDDND
jgi:uncharacterized protein (DUF2062 family)